VKSSTPDESGFTPERGKTYEVTIHSLSHGGSGVGRLEGFVFFVPYSAPGDVLEVEVTAFKKNYVQARIVRIIKASEQRQTPHCPVFGQCGGCQWQHVIYEEQLRQKELMVQHALSRIGREENIEIKPIKGSPSEFYYRNRAQFRTQGSKVGFYKRNSHELIDFEKCYIVESAINEELVKIKSEVARHDPSTQNKIEVFLSETSVHRSMNQAHSEETGFSQVNSKQNERMVDYVMGLVGKSDLKQPQYLLDLFCGNGNFSLPALMGQHFNVYGIDASRPAIAVAREQAQNKPHGLTAQFVAGDCSFEVKKLARAGRKFSTILLDPPRVGCDSRLWKNLVALEAETIIYISCDPSTFSRDWARLKGVSEDRYKIEFVQPFDMFPQTFHVELVAKITRSPEKS